MAKVKGRTTIRTAAVLFLVSAVLEITDYDSATAILGGLRFGVEAVIYHILFTALYIICGIGLWIGKRWGYWSVMAATAVYTIDKIQLVLFPQALYDHILQQLTITRDIIESVPKESFIQLFIIAYMLMVICWWGFAVYIYTRRDYFEDHKLQLTF